MTVKWNEGAGIGDKLIGKICGYLSRNGDDVRYESSSGFDELMPVICSKIACHEELSDSEKSRIVHRSLISVFRSGIVSLSNFIDIANNMELEFLSKTPRKFYMTSTISFYRFYNEPLFIRKVNDVRIIISPRFPKFLDAGDWFMSGFGSVDSGSPHSYACIYMSVQAKTESQAAEKMLGSLDLLISILNMEQNFGVKFFTRPHQVSPYNNVRLGLHQVLHYEDGKRYEGTVWHQMNYVEENFPKRLSERKNLNKFVDKWLKLLRNHPFEKELVAALKQYNAALSQIDYHIAIIMLWSALEIITDTTRSESKITIRRASAISKEPDLRRMKLENIASVRNRFVHVGEQGGNIEYIIEDMRSWVEAFLRYASYSGRMYTSMKDFVSVLDRIGSADSLKRELFIVRKALKLSES